MNTESEYYKYLDYIYSEVGHSYSNQLKDLIVLLNLDEIDENIGVYHTKTLPVRNHVIKKKKHKL